MTRFHWYSPDQKRVIQYILRRRNCGANFDNLTWDELATPRLWISNSWYMREFDYRHVDPVDCRDPDGLLITNPDIALARVAFQSYSTKQHIQVDLSIVLVATDSWLEGFLSFRAPIKSAFHLLHGIGMGPVPSNLPSPTCAHEQISGNNARLLMRIDRLLYSTSKLPQDLRDFRISKFKARFSPHVNREVFLCPPINIDKDPLD